MILRLTLQIMRLPSIRLGSSSKAVSDFLSTLVSPVWYSQASSSCVTLRVLICRSGEYLMPVCNSSVDGPDTCAGRTALDNNSAGNTPAQLHIAKRKYTRVPPRALPCTIVHACLLTGERAVISRGH